MMMDCAGGGRVMSLSIRSESDHDTLTSLTALLSHRHQLTLHIFPACLLLMAVG